MVEEDILEGIIMAHLGSAKSVKKHSLDVWGHYYL